MSPVRGPVLVVEDDANHALLIETAFREAGVEHPRRILRDGESVLAYLSGEGPFQDRNEHPWPALIILDLGLPGKTGMQVLEWMSRNTGLGRFRPVPTVILSSNTDPGLVERAYELGARAYVVKPAHFRDLVATVRSLATSWLREEDGDRGESGLGLA